MKKFLGVILTASMVMSSFTPVLAEEQNKIKVDRIAGADRYETSAKISKRTFPNHIKTVVLASGENFADSLVAGSLANKENAPVLLTQKEKLPRAIKDEVDRLNPEQIIIVGGEKSVNISGLKNVKRLAGKDRYQTSVEVYKYLNPNGKVALASGLTFADALCATPLSSKENLPIILTDGHNLPKGITKDKVSLIFGGEKSINIKGLENTRRLAGADRYETALIIAKEYGNLEKFVLADGRNYPDALSVAPLAHKNNQPILLTDPSHTEFIKQIVKDNKTKEITVVGGKLSVSSKQIEEIASVKITEDKKPDTPSVTPTPDNPSTPDKPDDKPGEDKPDDSAKEKALKEAKEKAIEELKENGITSPVYIDQINKAKTVEGVNALKEEIIKAHKKSEEEKPDEEKPDDSAKEKALKEAKEKAIEELKNNGITSPVYIDQINKAKTVEGVNALKEEIIKSHKKSEEEKPEEKPEDKVVEFGDAKLKEKLLNFFKNYDGKDVVEEDINEYNFKLLDKNYRIDPNATDLTVKDMEQLQSFGHRSFDENFDVLEFNSIKGLEAAKNLETLTISGNPDDSSKSFDDLTPLKDLKKLKLLRLSHNAIKDLTPLKDLTALEKLYISHNQIEDVSILNNLKNLKSLDISVNKVNNISVLKDLTNVENLDIRNNEISDISVTKNYKNLNWLMANNNKVKDISSLQNNTKLNYLNLENNQIEDVSPIADLSKLQTLNLNNNKITKIDASKLTDLTELYVAQNGLESIDSISKLMKLNDVNLSGNKLTSVEALKDLTELGMLDLSKNQIKDIAPLKNLAKLYNLDVHSNPIKDISVAKDLKQLGDINVSETQITDLTPLKAESIYSLEADKLSTTVSDVKLKGNIVEFDNPFKLIDKVFTKFKEIKSDNPKVKAEVTEDNKIKLTLEDGMKLKDIEGLKLEYSFDSKSYSDPVYSYSIELVNLKDSEAEKPEYVDIEDAKLLKVLNKNLDVNRKDDQRITKQEMESLKEVSIFLDKKTNKPIFTEESKDTFSILGKAQDLSNTKDFKFMVTRGMKSLKGIEYATNLEKLKVNENEISDLTPLKDLKNLKYLELQRNRIVDVSPLANLKNLEFLKLYNNIIENVEPLKDLTNLTGLDLHNNVKVRKENGKRINYDGITDISSLKNLTKLTFFDVSANRIENVDIILGMEKINHLDFSDNKISDYSKLADYILPRYMEQEEGAGSIGFHGQNVTQTQSVTVDNNKVSFETEYKGLGNLFNEFAKAFEMEDASELVNVTTNVEGVKATFDVKNDKINLEVTDEFLKENDGKTVNANLKIEFAVDYGWNLNDVKLQVKKPEEKPETPEEEKIAMIQEVTTSNLPAKDAIAKIKVAGQIKNIPSNKFIVKLVDEDGKETYPEIEVTGEASKAFRFINIKVPENTIDKEKTYEIYATSTGKKDKVFKSDVKITQQAGKAEDPKPETPEEEKITMIQEVTTSNLPAKDAIAKIRVIGQINNIPSDKFIVKLVDEDGKETYPEIEVTGDASKAFRVINIKVPENTTDKGKTYEIYATSTGKKDKVFKSDVKITQQAGKAEDPKPETPEEEKVSYEEILPSYAHASKDGKIIEVGFDEEIEEIFEDSLKAGISIDKNADGSYEKLESNDTVELSDKKFVVTLEKPLDVKGLGFNKAKIKINQGVFRKKGTENLNKDVDYYINIGKPIVRQATIEGDKVITNKNRKVTIKVNGMNLSSSAKVKAVMQTKLATEDTAVAKKGKQPEVQGTISGTDNEQTITFDLPENKTDRTVSYEILYKPEINGKFEKLPGNNPRSRANSIVISLVADGEDVNASTLAFMKIQTYGATSTDKGEIPDITYGVAPTNQESKKTFTHVYGTNLEATKTRVRIFDERGVEWYIVNQPSLGAAAFKMVVPALIGIDGDGNYQTMEIIGPGSLIGDHTFTYKVAVDGKNYDENVVVRAKILASGKTNDGKFDLENQETTLKLNYVDVDGSTIKISVEKKSYSFFGECAAGIYPDAIENYKPVKIVRKSDKKEIQLTDGVDYTDYRNLQTLLGVNKIGDNPEYTIVYEKTK